MPRFVEFLPLYNRYMEQGEEGGSKIYLPPEDPVPIHVLVLARERGLPSDLFGLISAFLRLSRIERLHDHLRLWLKWANDDGRRDMADYAKRQRRRLR